MGQQVENLNVVYLNDASLLELNIEHLNHDYYTDILTFDLRDNDNSHLLADIYISVDRVKSNSAKYSVTFEQELKRVIIHGILHLMGYNDKTLQEKNEMKNMEDHYLNNA